MNPNTRDYRDTVRAGEKTGSPFQADTAFRSKRMPRGSAVILCFLAAPFAWAAIIWAVVGLFR